MIDDDADPGQVVVAVDKFKGSLSSADVANSIAEGIHHIAANTNVITLPIADGGEGTLDAAIASGFRRRPTTVSGPTGEPVRSAIAVSDDTAVVELASASGLALLPSGRFKPGTATTRGVGELIRFALDLGHQRIVLGVGGSAGMDGGAGMLQALGARLLTATGTDIPPGLAGLTYLRKADFDSMDRRLKHVQVVLASDVDNPLLGPRGAVRTYGLQKGLSTREQPFFEKSLRHWTTFLPPGVADLPGAGAAGGVGVAALALLGAEFRYGAELVLDMVRFTKFVHGARLVVTGEGSLDGQTIHGKAPAIVAMLARRFGVPTVAICGRSTLTPEQARRLGLTAVYPLLSLVSEPQESIERASLLVTQLAEQVARDWLISNSGGLPC